MEVILIQDGVWETNWAIAKTYSDAIDYLIKERGVDWYWLEDETGFAERLPLTPDIIKEMYAWGIEKFNEVYLDDIRLAPFKLYEKE